MRHTPDASNNFETHGSNSVLLPDALKEEMPDVEFVVPMRPTPIAYVSADKANVKTTGSFVGKDFFNVFSYKLIQGSSNSVLQNKYAMVISDDLAIKLFGSAENCVGKSVNWGLNILVVITLFQVFSKVQEIKHQRSTIFWLRMNSSLKKIEWM
ncbi:MAG: ABC transporter permease [Flammeovirgaceae bacterium]|nr:ABC transporter permease [Flammeovirgaceae bacterium]